jgi:hypothetical protein
MSVGIDSAFAVAMHMHQPLIPVGGPELRTAAIVGNLQWMLEHPDLGDNHNAPVFQWCYKRMDELIPQLLGEGSQPRIMLEYSGTMLHGLRHMGLDEVFDALRPRVRGSGLESSTTGPTRTGWSPGCWSPTSSAPEAGGSCGSDRRPPVEAGWSGPRSASPAALRDALWCWPSGSPAASTFVAICRRPCRSSRTRRPQGPAGDPLHAMRFRASPPLQVSGVRPAQRPSPSDRDCPLDTAGDRCLWHVGGRPARTTSSGPGGDGSQLVRRVRSVLGDHRFVGKSPGGSRQPSGELEPASHHTGMP